MATTKPFTAAGNADNSCKGKEEDENEENPFSLLFQPPLSFTPRPLEDIVQLSSGPSPVDSVPSIGSSGHFLASNEPSLGSSGFANYRKKFQSQPVHEQSKTLYLSREQPDSNQATQCDASGMAWLFCIPCVHFSTLHTFCCICVTNLCRHCTCSVRLI